MMKQDPEGGAGGAGVPTQQPPQVSQSKPHTDTSSSERFAIDN